MTSSHALRLDLDRLAADMAQVRVQLARATEPEAVRALAKLLRGQEQRRRQLLTAHTYATARELADLVPAGEWRPAKARPVFGALEGRTTIPLHSNWRTR